MTLLLFASLALLSAPVLYFTFRLSGNAILPYLIAVKGSFILYIISLMLEGDMASAAGDISLICTGIVMLLASANLDTHYALAGGHDER